VVGGGSGDAETYDPNAGTWTAAGSSTVAAVNYPVTAIPTGCSACPPSFTATLLPTGKVLLVGIGSSVSGGAAELYDPTTRAFTIIAGAPPPVIQPSVGAHLDGTATLLPTGQVLLAGGEHVTGGIPESVTATAEMYDSTTGAFTLTTPLPSPLAGQTATVLADGRVLVAGGSSTDPLGGTSTTAYLFTPSSGTWATAPPMLNAHGGHVAARLDNGKVLVAGNSADEDLASVVELYDPTSNTWTALAAPPTRPVHTTMTRLNNGTFLIPPPGYVSIPNAVQCDTTGEFANVECVVCYVVSADQVVGYAIIFNPGLLPASARSATHVAAARPAQARSNQQSSPLPTIARRQALAAPTDPVITTLLALRDQVMAASPQGQYYTRLYYLNSPELVQIVLAHPDLFLWSLSTLREWQPPLQSLVNGQGSSVTISQQMINDLNGVLNEFSQFGSPGLASTIQREQAALNLSTFVNLPMDQAWALAQARIVVRPLPEVYLPLVAR
jgi:hypothetical protein